MRRPLVGMLLCGAACLTLLLPTLALSTPEVGQKNNGWSITDEVYLRTYEKCWKAFDSQCGRNIVDDGLSSGKPPSEARIKASTATMDRWLNPPVVEEPTASSSPVEYVAPAPTTSVAPASASTGGCVGMEAESGSAGYAAYNPSSGAAGCYQIIPSTAAAHGCDLSTPAGQDACAQAICATEGSGAWAASGANPC